MAEIKDNTENNSLQDFSWDDTGGEGFFGIKPGDKGESTSVIGSIIKDEEDSADFEDFNNPVETPKQKPVKVEKKKEAEVADETETTEEVTEEVEEKKKPKVKAKEKAKEEATEFEAIDDATTTEEDTPDVYNLNALKRLAERGGLKYVELPEDVEGLTDDEVIDTLEEEVKGMFDEQVKAWSEELPDTEKKAMAFMAKGGSIEEFARIHFSSSDLPVDLDITKEDNQERVLRNQYKAVDGWKDEDIDDRIEWLKEKGKLGNESAKYYQNYTKNKKDAEDALQANLEAHNKKLEQNRKEYNTTLLNKLKEVDTIFDIPLTKKDKEDLPIYFTKATVKVGDKQFVAGFHKDLNDALKDPETVLLLGKLLKTKFAALKDVKAAGGKEKLKQVKTTLRNQSQSQDKRSSGSGAGKSLADVFN